jgi:hypothetical protein
MRQPMQRASIYQSATTDAGAHCQINEVGDALRRAPARFAQGGAIHVGIESDGDAERLADRSRQIVIAPSRFGGRSDVASGKVYRAKGSDAHGLGRILAQEIHGRGGSSLRRSGWNVKSREVAWSGSHATDKLGSPRFNAA